ncbi:MAG: SCO family protein [Bdellovibrionaceae bacterium]|nr:SCO family protein [Pseudobdellovibrionaceae bacterium]
MLALLLSLQVAFANLPNQMGSVETPSSTQTASTVQPKELQGIGVTEKLGTQLNLDEVVRNENGESVPLRTFFNGNKPAILSLVYFACPGLCNFHLNGLIEGMKPMDWSPGQKFDVIAMSFDPHEGPDLAKAKKATYMKMYERPGTENGFHFVTADEATIKRITEAVGFAYKWDEAQKQWAHGSAGIVVSPTGKVTRYLHGIMFDAPTIKMALNEGGQGKVGSIVDAMVMYCFKYDPQQSKYVLYAFRLVQLGGVVIIIVLGLLLVPAWLRARRQEPGV